VSEALDDDRPSGLWSDPAPGKLVGPGHIVGDFLEAHEWDVIERRDGILRLSVHLPHQVRNPRGQLFGGFTPTYVDFVAIHTYRAGRERPPGRPWLATLNMRVDYFAPVVMDRFEIDSRVVNRAGSTCWVETRFLDPSHGPEGKLMVYAYTTLKEVAAQQAES